MFGHNGMYGDAWSGVAIPGWSLMSMNAFCQGIQSHHKNQQLLFFHNKPEDCFMKTYNVQKSQYPFIIFTQ